MKQKKEVGCRAYPDNYRDKEWCEYSQCEELCGQVRHKKMCPHWDGRKLSTYQMEKKDGRLLEEA